MTEKMMPYLEVRKLILKQVEENKGNCELIARAHYLTPVYLTHCPGKPQTIDVFDDILEVDNKISQIHKPHCTSSPKCL